VAVTAGRVSLSGPVPHDTARDELVRVAAAIPGVAGVDDQLEIDASV
jgi:osmotically-inducible protein OsmY